jgi:hypothetical protein
VGHPVQLTRFHCDSPAVTVAQVRAVDPEITLFAASACGHDAIYRCTQTLIDDVASGGNVRSPRPITVCSLDSAPSPPSP